MTSAYRKGPGLPMLRAVATARALVRLPDGEGIGAGQVYPVLQLDPCVMIAAVTRKVTG